MTSDLEQLTSAKRMIWEDDPDEEPIVETWEEYSVLFKYFSKYLTFSEIDKVERPVCLKITKDGPEESTSPNTPVIYASNYSIYTHKGRPIKRLQIFFYPHCH